MKDNTESLVCNDTDEGYDGEPVTMVILDWGTINVKLKNETNAAIDDRTVGYTEDRTLEGEEEHIVRELTVLAVIVLACQDDIEEDGSVYIN